jgi:hypothetical protein
MSPRQRASDKFKCTLRSKALKTKDERGIPSAIGFPNDQDAVLDAAKVAPDSNGRINIRITDTEAIKFAMEFDVIFDKFYVARTGFDKQSKNVKVSQSIRSMIRNDATRFFWLAAMIVHPPAAVDAIFHKPPYTALQRQLTEKRSQEKKAIEQANARKRKTQRSHSSSDDDSADSDRKYRQTAPPRNWKMRSSSGSDSDSGPPGLSDDDDFIIPMQVG